MQQLARLLEENKVKLCIDLKPALDFQKLDARLLRDFEKELLQTKKLSKEAIYDTVYNLNYGSVKMEFFLSLKNISEIF